MLGLILGGDDWWITVVLRRHPVVADSQRRWRRQDETLRHVAA
jgi:hypothetical protein